MVPATRDERASRSVVDPPGARRITRWLALGLVDLRAVKAASRPHLAACAIAAARNAQGLLQDAELLAGSGRTARAYSLAALAVEECGKAMDLTALAVMPEGSGHGHR
jgi:HEPN superfamily AbiV-like protein